MDAGGFQTQNDATVFYETGDRVCLNNSSSAELLPVSAMDSDLLPAWQKLARNASEPNIFYEHWMLGPALRHFPIHSELSLLRISPAASLLKQKANTSSWRTP